MTENKKRFRIDFTVDAEGWSDDYIKESAIQELTCMVPYPEDISFSEVDNPWHTGTPTEEGWYVCFTKDKDIPYQSMKFKEGWWWDFLDMVETKVSLDYVVAWQKIEPYEASKERE